MPKVTHDPNSSGLTDYLQTHFAILMCNLDGDFVLVRQNKVVATASTFAEINALANDLMAAELVAFENGEDAREAARLAEAEKEMDAREAATIAADLEAELFADENDGAEPFESLYNPAARNMPSARVLQSGRYDRE